MSVATYSPETGGSSLSALGRKVQAGVYKGAQYGVEEFGWFGELPKFNVALSQREITFEADIVEGTGANFITEGGKETRPSSPAPQTATVTFLLLNKRWTISQTTKMISGSQGMRAYVEEQFKWQGRKALEAIRKRFGDAWYGFSTGTLCKLADVASGPTYTLKDMYGVSGLGSTSHNRRCVDLFTAASSGGNRDYIADLDPGGPTLNSIQVVTAKDRTLNTITVDSAFTSDDIDDLIVFANSLENTTMAGGTERNLNPPGLLDMATSVSLHGISGGNFERWNASLANTAGGRFTGIKLMKARDAVTNYGGGKADLVIWAQGVKNDVVAQLQAGLRFSDAYAMEMEGAPKAKGVEFKTSRRVPDGYVFVMDSKNSMHKIILTPDVDIPGINEGDKLQDDSGFVYSADFIVSLACTNRSNIAYYSGLDQS